MKDVKKAAENRAAHPCSTPAGGSFESERKRAKAALTMQIDSLDSSQIHKIAAVSDSTEAPRKIRVAPYCRVSTDDIEQAISIRLQQIEYRDKIKANPNWVSAGMYVDNGFSGTNTAHRPGFLKLIEDCRAGLIDMVITKSVSRFARNLMDCIKYVEELKSLDPPVKVYFEQEKLDTSVQTSGIILIVLAMVAEEESHMKSEAMLLSLEWRFSRGRFLTPALFGYDKIEVPDGFGGKKKMLVVNSQQAKVVEWMYAMLVKPLPTQMTMQRSQATTLSREEQLEARRLAEESNFTYAGYQVVRREFVSHRFDPAMTVRVGSITFNNACIKALENATYVQFLINPTEKKLIVRPCEIGARDAIRWCVVKGADRKSRQITCKPFAERLYSMMGWEAEFRYRFQGMRIKYYQDEMYLFDLSADERFAPMKKDENGKRIVSAPVLPEHWSGSYGLSVEEHDMSTKLDFLDGFLMPSDVTKEETAAEPEEIE